MASNQGLNKLIIGYTKRLNKVEIKRNFLYISRDKRIFEVLDNPVDIYINDVYNSTREIDKYGRILGMKQVIQRVNSEVHINAYNRCLYMKTTK